MKNTVNLNSINLVNDDSLSYIKTLPDNCIDFGFKRENMAQELETVLRRADGEMPH